jgi:hypothetical protein
MSGRRWAECRRDYICQMDRSLRILSAHFLNVVSLVGECRREYMVGAPKALAGSSPVADPGSGFQQALVNLLSPILKGLRRMQEELHFNLRVPGSNPGCAFGAVAQRIEHQTPFAGVVSPIVVAAGPVGKVYCVAGECRREYIGPNGVSTPWEKLSPILVASSRTSAANAEGTT